MFLPIATYFIIIFLQNGVNGIETHVAYLGDVKQSIHKRHYPKCAVLI